MANRSRTKDLYDKLVEGFRNAPGNSNSAARYAGCDQRTAKKCWDRGWPDRGEWARPIRDAIAEELETARMIAGKRRAQLGNLKDDAAREATKARAQEGTLVRSARANTILLSNSIGSLLRGVIPAAMVIGEQMKQEADAGKGDPAKVIHFMSKVAYLARQASECMEGVLRAERMVLGANSGATGTDDQAVGSTEEALEILDQAERHNIRLRRAKGIVNPAAPRLGVIQGGHSTLPQQPLPVQVQPAPKGVTP